MSHVQVFLYFTVLNESEGIVLRAADKLFVKSAVFIVLSNLFVLFCFLFIIFVIKIVILKLMY